MNLLCYFGLLCLIPDRVAGTNLNATSFLQEKVEKKKKDFCAVGLPNQQILFLLNIKELQQDALPFLCSVLLVCVSLFFFKAEF